MRRQLSSLLVCMVLKVSRGRAEVRGAYGLTNEWRHPAEKRTDKENVKEWIRRAKLDAIASSMAEPRERIPVEAAWSSRPRHRQHNGYAGGSTASTHDESTVGKRSGDASTKQDSIVRIPGRPRNRLLNLNVQVEGKWLQAFIDTGAEVTVMSAACARQCGLMGRLDRRHAGIAKGVGSADILGKIHNVLIRVGNTNLLCTFCVIENSMEMLIGLDTLKKYECDISLRRNSITFTHGDIVQEASFCRGR